MKNYKFLSLIFISFFFVALPLISNAQWVPTGKPCSSEVVYAYDHVYEDNSKEVTCYFSSLKGGDLHIKWHLPGINGEPIGKDIVDVCDISTFYGPDLKYKREGERPPLRRVDDVYLIEPQVGAAFYIRCIAVFSRDSKDSRCSGKVGDLMRFIDSSNVASSHIRIVSPDDSGQGTSKKTSLAEPSAWLASVWSALYNIIN